METTRRCANYPASTWDDDFVQSLTSPYAGGGYVEEAEKLKRMVGEMMEKVKHEHVRDQVELVDLLQRLDISYHFNDGIQKLLDNVFATADQSLTAHKDNNTCCPTHVVCHGDGCIEMLGLYATALQFRLLRQNGYNVSQEVFRGFIDEVGDFKACLAEDVKGLLSLYEASFLSVEGETLLDLAKDFATHHLKLRLEETRNKKLADQIRRALEIPVHWRVQKLEARWFIDIYEARSDANPTLLQLAKLNFNMVQAKYQEELKSLSRWYKETHFPEKLRFARHRLVEGFLWALGFTPEPDLAYSRKILCRLAVLITVMDDIYDLYGTMDELEALTEITQRWDINKLESLPEYMQIAFLALFNSSNEMAYDVMRDQGVNIISHLRNLWAEMSRVFLVEARWYHKGYFPSLDEYLNVAWISASGPLVLVHAYLSIANPIISEELASLEQYPGVIRWPSMVLRLTNDLATASGEMKKGDAPSSIQCYMNERGCSEEDARGRMKQLIETSLKRMNKEILRNQEEEEGMKNEKFRGSAVNLARIALCVYQFGDGMGLPHRDTKRNLLSLIVQPIPPSHEPCNHLKS